MKRSQSAEFAIPVKIPAPKVYIHNKKDDDLDYSESELKSLYEDKEERNNHEFEVRNAFPSIGANYVEKPLTAMTFKNKDIQKIIRDQTKALPVRPIL